MKIVYQAIWYDPDKCEQKAIAAGWDPNSGDGFLDIYFPEEDPNGHESKNFDSLEPAVDFLKKLISKGKDFWGQTRINKIEVDGKRCQYCTCRGWNCVHTYLVEAEGIVEESAENNCCDD
jgi:hypothetical protein